MNPAWPFPEESLADKVAAHRRQTASERLRVIARLFEFYRGLIQDPERRARWEAARRSLEAERRAEFKRLLPHGL